MFMIGLAQKAIATTLLVGLASTSIGCAPMLTGAAAVGVKAWEDRSTEDQVTDVKIHTGILERLQDKDSSLVIDISTDVWEQRVMLTGTVNNTDSRNNAVKAAKTDTRIKTLYNHIKVVSTESRDQRREQTEKNDTSSKEGTGQWFNDVWIETKIKGQLLVASSITSVNFFWRSVLNEVYVIGRAKTRAERNKVLNIIQQTEGVKNVTHHIEVR